jgi:ABC-type amino acid transport substrate-binding protein
MLEKGRFSVLILILVSLLNNNICFAEGDSGSQHSIDIVVGEWPPYTTPQKPFKGILSHIVSAAYETQNLGTNYQFTDWPTAYKQTQTDDPIVSIGWVHDSERAEDMYFSDPISHITLSFFHRKDMEFTWYSLDDLKTNKVGYVKGYSYGDSFNQAVEGKHLTAIEFDNPQQAFQALLLGKVDLVPSDNIVGQHILNEMGAEGLAEITFDEHPLYVTPVHMIANRHSPDSIALVDKFNLGLKKLKQSGRYRNILSTSSLIDAINQLTFITEESAPLNYRDKESIKGVSVGIVSEILRELESNIGPERFQILPWARAYTTLLNEDNIVLFSMVQTPERKSKFQWVGPIHRTNVVLFANKDDKPEGRSLKDFAQQRICAVREDVGAQLIATMGHSEKYTTLVHSPQQCAKMLHLGRVAMWAYGSDTGRWYLSKTGAKAEQFEEVLHLHESFRYIAFSNDVSQTVVNAFQSTLDYLSMNGRLQEIIRAELASIDSKRFVN